MKQETNYDRVERLAYEKTLAEIQNRILREELNNALKKIGSLIIAIEEMERAK